MSFLVVGISTDNCFLLGTEEKFFDEPLSSCSIQKSDVRFEVTGGNEPLRRSFGG